jgi:PhzF family phenazine biosynthesis protein
MTVSIFQVDAFTGEPFAGNPAAVCLLPGPAEEGWMQKVAREMNLSETAFIHQVGDSFGLRWFTPALEVELCGHATLASAHILWESGRLAPEEYARFQTASGVLEARLREEEIEMDFPATPEEPSTAPSELLEALKITPVYVGRSRFDYLLEVGSEDEVRDLDPDFALLKRQPLRGVMVTSRSKVPEFDFVSRFFAPGAGIDEDPVTGSAHCCLGPYWSRKLDLADLTACQISKRGGVLRVSPRGERVVLGGRAVTVFRGELMV